LFLFVLAFGVLSDATGFAFGTHLFFLFIFDVCSNQAFQRGARDAELFRAAVNPEAPLSGREIGQPHCFLHHAFIR